MSNYFIKDGYAVLKEFKSTDNAGVHTPHQIIDVMPDITIADIPLPPDAATQTTLAALLAELELKANLAETQPVSVASLPLPADAATQTTLAAILAELELKANLAETQPVSGPLTDTELRASPVVVGGLFGEGDIVSDAWGIQKMSLPHSLFHGMWTFDIPASMWFMYENGTQVYTSTNIVSTGGAAVITADSTKTAVILESRQCPRYQPNRGHLFSSALWAPLKTAGGTRVRGVRTLENGVFFRLKSDGLLYAVLRSNSGDTYEEEIDTSGIPGFDVEKGNVYDIQYQWRGVGNYKFFINLQLVHTISNLGTLTALSMENPALPASFRCTRSTEDVSLYVGCCDITSENGDDDMEQAQVADATASTNGTNIPVISIYNPLQISGKTNTRTIVLDSITVNSANKATFNVWVTRDPAHLTGEAFAVISGSGSYVQVDTTASAITAGPRKIAVIQAEANVRQVEKFAENPRLRVTLVRGDYLIVTCTGTTASRDVIIRWGEEI